MLWFIVLLDDPWPWPITETQLSDTGPYIAQQNSLVVFRFHDAMHTVKASSARSSKATPKYLWTSTMFERSDCVLFFEGLISFSTIMCFTKKLYFGLICPHDIQMATDSASWHCCTQCLQVSLNLFGSSLSAIRTILRCNFSSFFLFCPRPGRLATVDTGTSRSLQMDL